MEGIFRKLTSYNDADNETVSDFRLHQQNSKTSQLSAS